ncbi:PREDICTED: uncharacterized protein LOC104809267 isoform X2 [Tarenaya hassleriana]|uniref:uncharacterized protein LOC104809267 isoform X2 n=1 Tax=Tarenaya hassleriana TaxID=28532 RepID=UPI00053C13F5|nr:PREDICTED: uncharacterized protein LOC104809267 isoform X2 [Tarenaya hassleriana]
MTNTANLSFSLQKKKLSELDEVNREQEEKFLHFVSSAEELVRHLRSENKNLQGIAENLRSELTSVRFAKDKDCAEYQKLLMEEEQKNKTLSEEVEKLKEMLQEEHGCGFKGKTGSKQQAKTPESARVLTRSMRKRDIPLEDMVEVSMKKRSRTSKDMTEVCMTSPNVSSHRKVAPVCYKNSHAESSDSVNCTFQTLGEYLLGMQLSISNQVNGVGITTLHPSSGYSFRLTWVNNSGGGEEPELLYNLVSLGTFERVAPEWMKGVLMFSISMCPAFFERVSRVIKLQC